MQNDFRNRTYLSQRHRLSHQQIDHFLGENRAREFMAEKLQLLNAVNNFLFINDLLSRNGITVVNLKGPLLSHRIYGDASVRFSRDFDLFVEIDQLGRVVELLLENGFHFTEGSNWPEKKIQQEMLLKMEHHLSFYNNEHRFLVEIHWVLSHTMPISLKRQKEIIAANLTEEVFAERKFTVLNKELELLYLLIHGSKHGWFRLKWLIDIHKYPVNNIDKEEFLRLATLLKAERIIGQANFLLQRFFNSQLPFPGAYKLPGYFTSFALLAIDSTDTIPYSVGNEIKNHAYSWYMFQGLKYKFKIINGIFLRKSDIPRISSSFKIAYYLYRPYSFIKRRFLHS